MYEDFGAMTLDFNGDDTDLLYRIFKALEDIDYDPEDMEMKALRHLLGNSDKLIITGFRKVNQYGDLEVRGGKIPEDS